MAQASIGVAFGTRGERPMSDLIWVGNTLYPRWFVIIIVVMVFLTPFIIAGIVQIVLKFKRWR